jgi:hypothetical protein
VVTEGEEEVMVVVSEIYPVVFLKARLLLSLQVMVPIRLVSSSHTTHISFIVCTGGGHGGGGGGHGGGK